VLRSSEFFFLTVVFLVQVESIGLCIAEAQLYIILQWRKARNRGVAVGKSKNKSSQGWKGVIEEREGSEAGIAALARSCKSHAS
jgi:hypothetical protein